MDVLFDEINTLLDTLSNAPPTVHLETSTGVSTAVKPTDGVQAEHPHEISTSCCISIQENEKRIKKDVILLSSSNKKERIPKESNAGIQNLPLNSGDTQLDTEIKLADFFKPGPLKRKSTSKKSGIVYSKRKKHDL
jgi:hypothetical protein